MINYINKSKLKVFPHLCLIGCGILLLFIIIGFSVASILDNDVEVKANSELIYYLNVNYDGVDKVGNASSDKATAEVKSDVIHVEDKIPEGLIFNGFVTTSDGSIGAVSRGDGTICTGKVVDDTDGTETLNSYHGLHYDEATRIVSFDVKGLKAGCVLTVGIKTMTPTIDDPTTPEKETRRDFYNFATFKEGLLTGKSNTVHAWMGKEDLTMYKVSYEYEGTVPSNAPSVPEAVDYVAAATVGVAGPVNVAGYEFSGWTTTDVTVEDNDTFKMPEKNVVFKGSFTEIPKYEVSYNITGTIPEGYVTPSTKSYYPEDTVSVDSLKAGDVFNGYRFLGWTTTDVTISEDRDFQMPEKNVTITGQFEEVKYTVTYKFYETVIPTDASGNPVSPPPSEQYKPGETVKLPTVSEVDGYTFLGWYKEDNFTMPEEDIIIYGEWKEQPGIFEPTITKEVVNEKAYYQSGDKVSYRITVTNTAAFPINSVTIKEENANAYFVEGTGYEVVSPHNVRINSLAAGSSVILSAEYKVTSSDKGTIKNEVSITGALATNKYLLNPDKEYKDTATFKVKPRIKICKTVNKTRNSDDKFQVHLSNTNYDSWIVLENNECKTASVIPGSYKIEEIIPQDYLLESVTGSITANATTLNVELGKNYEINFNNKYDGHFFFRSIGRVENKISKAYSFN